MSLTEEEVVPAHDPAVDGPHKRRNPSGEADHGLWQRVDQRRALIEGLIIYSAWRLLILVPITFWPAPIFPLILFALLLARFLPPVWAALRIIATRREKMSRRFFRLSVILASGCAVADLVFALLAGDPAQPYGGPRFGPNIMRFAGGPHPLGLGTFLAAELLNYGILLVFFLIATICTRLAQGGFLRFTMPTGDGRVTL